MFFEQHRNCKSHYHYISTIKGVFGMLKDPDHTQSIFDIENGMKHLDATRLGMEYVKTNPRMAQMIEERYLCTVPDTQALLNHPEGSLGYCYARHLDDRGYDPDYYEKIDIKDDVDYVLMRLRQTHDIWHVMTGFGTSRIGEIGIKAVELAQTRRPMAAVITTGGVLRYMSKEPEQLGEVLHAISTGYQMGLKAELLLAERWEDNWERQVTDWRAELNIEPVDD